MKKFWLAISAAIVVAFIGVAVFPMSTSYDGQAPLWAKVDAVASLGILVAAIWAILFRKQLEAKRISLASILILIAMEAVMLAVRDRR